MSPPASGFCSRGRGRPARPSPWKAAPRGRGGGWLVQSGGTFRYTGGTIRGEYTAINTELDVAGTVTATH